MKCLKCDGKMMFLGKVGKESADWRKKRLEQWGIYKKYRGVVKIYGCWEDESFLVAPTPKQDYFFFSEGTIAKKRQKKVRKNEKAMAQRVHEDKVI